MTAETYSFFSVDAYDEDTGFVVREVYLENLGASRLPEFIRQKIQNLKRNVSESLERALIMECPEFKAEIAEWGMLGIRLRHESSALPYRVHGGRELDLMMKGLKPLSVFSHVEPSSNLASYLSRYLEPLVRRGELVSAKIDNRDGDDASTAPTLMFALPNQAWRIEAYRLMMLAARSEKWNDALERIEGSLLGYTPDQNDFWISHQKRHGYRWGLQTMYRFLSDSEASFVRKAGCKVFPFDDNPVRLYLPYDNPDPGDEIAALMNLHKMTLARFYAPMVKFMKFSQGTIRVSNLDFEVFEVPSSDLSKLNELIDGTVDIIELPELATP
jgi:hypothetical protein